MKKIMIMIAMLLTATTLYAAPFWSPLTDSVNSGIINTKMVTSDSLSNINVDATVIDGVAIFISDLVHFAYQVCGQQINAFLHCRHKCL